MIIEAPCVAVFGGGGMEDEHRFCRHSFLLNNSDLFESEFKNVFGN